MRYWVLLLMSGSSWMKSHSVRLLAPDLIASLRAREGSDGRNRTNDLTPHWRAVNMEL
jgi:hypothetical protein